jgi:hypothetical protein
MSAELTCWEIKVGFKEMDMSGGDVVDGPRWTGEWLDEVATVRIVAHDKDIASAVALSMFYEHQKAAVKSAKKLCGVHRVVTVADK